METKEKLKSYYIEKDEIDSRLTRMFSFLFYLKEPFQRFDQKKFDITGLEIRKELKKLRRYIKDTEDIIQAIRSDRKQRKKINDKDFNNKEFQES